MKKIYIMTLASLLCAATNVRAEEGTTTVPVKMTYVDYSNPDQAFGEIAEGETARTGFNKISGGSVGFGNTGWGVNYITYLQVNVSEVEGNITSATLSFDASEGSDGKRTQTYGVGYNSSEWSSDMTYNSADKSIILMGGEQSGSQKYADRFKTFSFDITEAVNNANKDGLATILIYETVAAGGYVKNPTVNVNWTTASTYAVTFTETSGVEATITLNGNNVTAGVTLSDGTYTFTATAPGYQTYTGDFTVEGADKNVEFTMTPNATLSYTVKNNVNNEVITGTCLEGLSVSVPYSRYILAEDGQVWLKDATNKEYNYQFTPNADNYEATLTYSQTDMTDGICFIEAEDIEGMTKVTGSNANVRCSNAAGGYAEEAIDIYTLNPGTYKVAMGVFGNKGATFILKAGEETILSAETQGYWYEATTEEEFTLTEETTLTFEGATSSKPLDYVLITGTVDTGSAVKAVEVAEDNVWYNLQGVKIAEPTQKGLFIHNGKKVIVK